jgi:hypothetical protein
MYLDVHKFLTKSYDPKHVQKANMSRRKACEAEKVKYFNAVLFVG